MNGLLLVDKPAGITSHDVVDRMRRAAGLRRIGHTGTLDPAATGLLVLCLGKATRLSEHLTGLDKVYEGTMQLGIVTDSHDLDGEVLERREVPALSKAQIQQVCDGFVGEIEQVPPMVSAVRIGGERLYKRARKGETVERPARRVVVQEFTVLEYAAPVAKIRVACSSGTYVRSLCHEVGQTLGCGAVLASLRRTRVGRHRVEDALPVDAFTGPEVVAERLLPMDDALDLPVVTVRASSRAVLDQGGLLATPDFTAPCPAREGWVQLKSESGRLLALGVVQGSAAGALVQPKRVFTG